MNKQEALQHYAKVDKPTLYLQLDGFTDEHGFADPVVNPGGERNTVMITTSYELWHDNYTLRIHIKPTAKKEDVLELLRDAIQWIESDGIAEMVEGLEPPALEAGQSSQNTVTPDNVLNFPGKIPF